MGLRRGSSGLNGGRKRAYRHKRELGVEGKMLFVGVVIGRGLDTGRRARSLKLASTLLQSIVHQLCLNRVCNGHFKLEGEREREATILV